MKCGRCDFRADDLAEHAADAGHLLCIVCQRRSLTPHEAQTCSMCAGRVRDDLDAIAVAYHDIERRLRQAGYRGSPIDWLAILGDGSTQGGGVDDDLRFRDPCSAAAQLEAAERYWRDEFGHGRPGYPSRDTPAGTRRRPAHVFDEAHGYLTTWLPLAARTHPGFDDFAAEIRELRSLLEHVAGIALDPKRAPIPCSCGGRLEQHYAEHVGLSDNRICRACGTVYRPSDYLWRYRMLTELPGWVSVERAAEATDRSEDTIWAWVRALEVPSVCQRVSRRIVVELAVVEEKSDATPRQTRRRTA